MPSFEETAVCRVPARTVWKLLHDPNRFVDWWSGLVRSEPGSHGALIRADYAPEVEVPLRINPLREGSGVMMRCLVTDTVYSWQLQPHPQGCLVRMRVDVPGSSDEDLIRYTRASMLRSLPRLVSAAEHAERADRKGAGRRGG